MKKSLNSHNMNHKLNAIMACLKNTSSIFVGFLNSYTRFEAFSFNKKYPNML